MGNRRFVTWAARLALLLASLTICLVLVEVVARLTSEQPDWAPPPVAPAELANAKVYETVFQLLQRNAKGTPQGSALPHEQRRHARPRDRSEEAAGRLSHRGDR